MPEEAGGDYALEEDRQRQVLDGGAEEAEMTVLYNGRLTYDDPVRRDHPKIN